VYWIILTPSPESPALTLADGSATSRPAVEVVEVDATVVVVDVASEAAAVDEVVELSPVVLVSPVFAVLASLAVDGSSLLQAPMLRAPTTPRTKRIRVRLMGQH